jgi:type I restriction enzyme R subunit
MSERSTKARRRSRLAFPPVDVARQDDAAGALGVDLWVVHTGRHDAVLAQRLGGGEDAAGGSANIQSFFDKLLEFTQELSEEDSRAIAESLSEEELAIFDLLTKPDPALTRAEEQEVKKVARDLLATLKHEKLVLDWRKRQQSKAAVWVAIEEFLDKLPAAPYTVDVYRSKCNAVYQHVYDAYQDAEHSIYATAN